MLTETADYAKLRRDFRWNVPEHFNIGTATVDKHADGSGKLALIDVGADGRAKNYSFDDLQKLSNRFANVLKADGIARGDRVAVFLSQSVELPVVHLAAFRSGLVSVPLFTLFGEDALEFRLTNSEAKAIVTDEGGLEKLARIRDRVPELKHIYVVGEHAPAGTKSFRKALDARPTSSRLSSPAPTIRRSSSTRRAPPEIRKARCMRIGCCSATCRTSRCATTSFQNLATSTGRRRTGRGSADCSTRCFRPGIAACRSSPAGRGNSSRRRRSG